MMEFNTPYKRNGQRPELNSGKKIVETAGYLTIAQRINNLMSAGKRLKEFRKEQFDFQRLEDVDENFNDPTRSKGFDMADASAHANDLELRMAEEVKKQAKLKKELKTEVIENAKDNDENNNANDVAPDNNLDS